ncbi:hypothetical protein MBLNU459_g4182t1 [Dothideomycetes sp. NU459]
MATSSAHPAFPSRPYTSGLGRAGGGAQPQPTFAPPQSAPYAGAQQSYPAPQGGFGAAAGTTQQQREAQRLERERLERADRERREAEERGAVEALSEEQREEINEAAADKTFSGSQFALFDLDKDGHIDYHELKVALKALGFDLPKSDILNLLQAHGIALPNSNAKLAQQQTNQKPTFSGPARLVLPHAAFVSIAAQRIMARDPRDEILRAFELFDAEGKGTINLADLRRVARELGEGLQEEELVAMIEEFDLDGDGAISRDEFVGICLG